MSVDGVYCDRNVTWNVFCCIVKHVFFYNMLQVITALTYKLQCVFGSEENDVVASINIYAHTLRHKLTTNKTSDFLLKLTHT